MKKYILLISIVFLACTAMAQNNQGGQNYRQNARQASQRYYQRARQANRQYKETEKEARERYFRFRDSLNAKNIEALGGKWEWHTMNEPEEPMVSPTPSELPKAPVRVKQEVPEKIVLPAFTVEPAPDTIYIPKIENLLPPMPEVTSKLTLHFYGANLLLETPKMEGIRNLKLKDASEASIQEVWKQMNEIQFEVCVNSLCARAAQYRLNDWARFELIQALVADIIPGDNNLRTVAAAYLLNEVGMNYDVQIGITKDEKMFLMLGIEDKIYFHNYIDLDGKRYYAYVFGNRHEQINQFKTHVKGIGVETEKVEMSMRMKETPRFPYQPADKPACLGGSCYLNHHMNENLLDFYHNYPQVDDNIYAEAAVDSAFNAFVEEIVRPMVKDLSPVSAVGVLLHLVQGKGKECYMTDGEQFGREKSMFPEESLYYPYTDCEDNAILFTYLVRRLVGVDAALTIYENNKKAKVMGHAAAAVSFGNESKSTGAYYEVGGEKYYVCDPTYFFAGIGERMPQYDKVPAKILKLRKIK